MWVAKMSLEKICLEFTDEKVLSVVPLEEGHINDTYIVKTQDKKYVLQCVQRSMDAAKLKYNYDLYSVSCDRKNWLYPKFIKTYEGSYFHKDDKENDWRMYEYIEADVLNAPLYKDELFACGEGLAEMHDILNSVSGKPEAVYPHFHNLDYYYKRYCESIKEIESAPSKDYILYRDESIEKEIERKAERFLKLKFEESYIIHGDPKISNFLFRNGRVAGFLDFDTVMCGSIFEDIADCIRSCCVSGNKFDKNSADTLIEGYEKGLSVSRININCDMKRINDAFEKICFELALRYYTDVISKEKIFKEKYPGYLLERAKNLNEISNYLQ